MKKPIWIYLVRGKEDGYIFAIFKKFKAAEMYKRNCSDLMLRIEPQILIR